MKSILILSCFSVLFACNNNSEGKMDATFKSQHKENNTASEVDKVASFAGPYNNKDGSTSTIAANRKIIWNGSVEMQVQNVEESSAHIAEMVEKNGGFISDMQTVNDGYRKSNTITIRMVRPKFQSTINSLKKEASFLKSATINSEDVTEEYVDIESRLKTKKDVRERYIDVLRNKAGSVKDIIEAEEAIRQITEEIEVQEGRMRYLNDKLDLSTITVEIFQTVKHREEPIVYEETYGSKIGNGFATGWHAIQGFLLGLITIWPLMLILAGIVYWKRKWLRTLIGK